MKKLFENVDKNQWLFGISKDGKKIRIIYELKV